MDETTNEKRVSGGRLVTGIFLLVIGVLFLAGNLGFDVPERVWSYWPILVLGLGVAKLVTSDGSDGTGGGYWLIVVGIWGCASVFHWFGLNWGTSWPIFIIAAGLLMATGLSGRGRRRPRWRSRDEVPRER
jgi:hypothetical protein